MELLSNLAQGFGVVASPENLTFCLIGALFGTLIGVLPGIGPVPTIAMLLPFTFTMQPVPALIMMAGIDYGAQYGGSTRAILVNMPGESFSVVTCLDGYQLARQGRAGVALGSSGLAEIAHNLSHKQERSVLGQHIKGLFPTAVDMGRALPAIVRGTTIGSLLGVLPGGGAVHSAFSAYTFEKKIVADPARFGRGAIEGVAAPEAATNAGAQTSFLPLLTLGIPPNPVMALMVGAMMIHGIQPGPQVMLKQPELFWGLIASMWLGNLMLLVINLPLIGIWVRLLAVPCKLLFPVSLLFCCTGVYSLNNSAFEVGLTALFGVMGYFFLKAGCEGAPLLLGFVLGPLMEENLRRALLLAQGDAMVFLQRPIGTGLLVAAALLLAAVVVPALRATREKAFQE
jgi:putative tricarboxylic transport membrane protein